MRITVLALATVISGCASFDFTATTFERSNITIRECYIHRSFADVVYPIDSPVAEATRLSWLQRWLQQNSIIDVVITDRTAMKTTESRYKIIYTVCKR